MTRRFMRPMMIGALSIFAGMAAQVSPASAQLFWDWGGGEESNGLGLSIVKHLIESQSGAVGADFPATGGSIFWFELPTR